MKFLFILVVLIYKEKQIYIFSQKKLKKVEIPMKIHLFVFINIFFYSLEDDAMRNTQ
ncbi:Hypothetical protein Ccan_21760 [Capnocytophaga canimorsus Cc5]|uniref:Uncharacterized protein n=1 Tax=Capnocytophaga canimorsus (strain 5) TaxID=860228 RepID=F9YUQ4_CAPCC|nr:Hypothetical protein Ccan_21760 [Capnocytophaga canimorsus Cc5]